MDGFSWKKANVMKLVENNRPRTKHILFLLNGVGCTHIFSRKQQSIGTLQCVVRKQYDKKDHTMWWAMIKYHSRHFKVCRIITSFLLAVCSLKKFDMLPEWTRWKYRKFCRSTKNHSLREEPPPHMELNCFSLLLKYTHFAQQSRGKSTQKYSENFY